MRSKKTKGMVAILVFFVPAIAEAALTINDPRGDNVVVTALPDHSQNCPNELFINHITGHYTFHLAYIANEFNKPSVSFLSFKNPSDGIKPLPAVPGTILMVSMGFLCISLIKDRNFWLNMLTGLLCAGKTGFVFLPNLALRIAGKTKTAAYSLSLNKACLCVPKYYHRLRSEIEGTFYIGLLRYLAGIPYRAETFSYQIRNRNIRKLHFQKSEFLFLFNQVINFVVLEVWLSFCYFSKLFIIANLARGPPLHV